MTRQALTALFWKEWKEHQMRIVACCVVMGVAAVVGLQPSSRSAEAMFPALMFIAAFVLPLFVAMALGLERHHGQITTLIVQPVPAIAVFAVKTLLGCSTVVAPVLTVTLIARLVMPERAYANEHVPVVALYASLAAVVTFIWMISLGARGPNEVWVGIAGIGVLGLWLGGMVAYIFIYELLFGWDSQLPDHLFVAANPFYFLSAALGGKHMSPPWWNIPVAFALWVWGARRFGVVPARRADGIAPKKGCVRSIAVRSPIVSLVWKEWRLNRTWLGTGLAVFVAFPIALLVIDFLSTANRVSSDDAVEFMTALMFSCMPVLTILVAVTTFSRELQPSAFELLQAQPISSARWFVLKYLAGLVVTLSILGAPLLLLLVVVSLAPENEYWVHRHLEEFAALSIPLTWVVLLYCIAALLTAFLPQPIYAGILSLGAILMLFAMSFYESFAWLDLSAAMDEPGWDTARGAVNNWLSYGLPLVLAAIAATWLAWRIVRWNWWTEPASITPTIREQPV